MDRCNYIVTHTSGMVEIPINGGQYHQMIASLWISHLVEHLQLTPVMLTHLDSALLTNPRQTTTQPGTISSLSSLIFESLTGDLPLTLLNFKTTVVSIFPFHSQWVNYHFIFIDPASIYTCHFPILASF